MSSTAWSELLASAMEIIMSKLLFFGAMTVLNEQRNVINNLEGIGSTFVTGIGFQVPTPFHAMLCLSQFMTHDKIFLRLLNHKTKVMQVKVFKTK